MSTVFSLSTLIFAIGFVMFVIMSVPNNSNFNEKVILI